MSAKSINVRHALYVAAAVITAASAGLEAVEFSNLKSVIGYLLAILGSGVITSRAFIDKSPAENQEP